MSNRLGKATLNESNPLSLITDRGRSEQRDYYRLENRDKKLEAVENLDADEVKFVLGNAENDDVRNATPAQAKEKLKKAIHKIHEQDLIELRALVYLQRLPDTSPEYQQLRMMTGMNTREEIAQFIAEKQIRKLMMSQLEAITGGSALTALRLITPSLVEDGSS
jgi:hypothetical protein